jgi:hypothetical protein
MHLRSSSAAGVRFLTWVREGRGLNRSAREAGIGKETGYRWLREAYVAHRRGGKSIAETEAVMGRETGKPIAQVARELGSSDAQGERQEQIWISATTLSTAAGSATNRRSDRRACRAGADMTIRDDILRLMLENPHELTDAELATGSADLPRRPDVYTGVRFKNAADGEYASD